MTGNNNLKEDDIKNHAYYNYFNDTININNIDPEKIEINKRP